MDRGCTERDRRAGTEPTSYTRKQSTPFTVALAPTSHPTHKPSRNSIEVTYHNSPRTTNKVKRQEWHAHREFQLNLMNHTGLTTRCAATPKSVTRKPRSSTHRLSTETEATSIGKYSIGAELGKGACATVFEGYSTTQKVAIKRYNKKRIQAKHQERAVLREVSVLSQLSHPGVVELVDTVDTSEHFYVVMEYVKGESLLKFLKRRQNLDLALVRNVFKQVVEIVEYCHEMGVTHRDIKLENLLIDSKHRVKLIDFGFSTVDSSEMRRRLFCGTPIYMAPEIFSQQEYRGPPVDIWALGVLLYVLVTGNYPFGGDSDKTLRRSVLQGKVEFPVAAVPVNVQKLIRKMLRRNPDQRLTVAEVLNDQWLSPCMTSYGTMTEQSTISSMNEGQPTDSSAHIKARPGLVRLKINLSRAFLK